MFYNGVTDFQQMFSIPFATYDVLGYLASGAVVVGGLQLLTGFPPLFGQPLTPVDAGAALLGIYIAGQIVASPAKTVLEDWFVHRILGPPSRVLFEASPSGLARRVPASTPQPVPYVDHLKFIRPTATVISVGSNSHGHPDPQALALYAQHTSGPPIGNKQKVWRTDEMGTMMLDVVGEGSWWLHPWQ